MSEMVKQDCLSIMIIWRNENIFSDQTNHFCTDKKAEWRKKNKKKCGFSYWSNWSEELTLANEL